MEYKQKNGFTIIEFVVVIVIVAVLSLAGAHMMTFMIQSTVFIPSELNMDMVAADAMDTMIEGDARYRGLRFSRGVIDVPQPYQVTFENQDGFYISYRVDTVANKLYRSIAGLPGGDELIPYYASSAGASLMGKDGKVFTYYDANGDVTGNAGDVRRIDISIISMAGSGAFEDWQGQADLSSSIAVKRF